MLEQLKEINPLPAVLPPARMKDHQQMFKAAEEEVLNLFRELPNQEYEVQIPIAVPGLQIPDPPAPVAQEGGIND